VRVAGALCSGCTGAEKNAAGQDCAKYCPFNSDEAPPKMDDRSDAKGPEPECVITGVMPDGKRLAFIGLERTGGIIVYDVTTPGAPIYQDYLNVRNWLGSSADIADFEAAEASDAGEGPFLVKKGLNDGPESCGFITAEDSPVPGVPVLLAVTPLAGRLSVYEIEEGEERADDGSCPYTKDCPYLPTTEGGSGLYVSSKKTGGLSTYDPTAAALPDWAIPVIAAVGGVALVICLLMCCLIRSERKGKPVFTPLDPASKGASAAAKAQA
jgi:hypothetical protein